MNLNNIQKIKGRKKIKYMKIKHMMILLLIQINEICDDYIDTNRNKLLKISNGQF